MVKKHATISSLENKLKEQSELSRSIQEQCDVLKNELCVSLTLKDEINSRLAIVEKELDSERASQNFLDPRFDRNHKIVKNIDGTIVNTENPIDDSSNNLTNEISSTTKENSEYLKVEIF